MEDRGFLCMASFRGTLPFGPEALLGATNAASELFGPVSLLDARDSGGRGVARGVMGLGVLLPRRLALLQNHTAHKCQG